MIHFPRAIFASRLALVAGCLIFVVGTNPAQATPASGFTAVLTFKGTYPEIDMMARTTGIDGTAKPTGVDLILKSRDPIDLYVVRNSIAIDGQSGWHTHPGPSLITVTVGEIMAYDGENPLCTPKRYTAGQGFIDTGGGDVHLLRNESGAPAETVAVQFLPVGAVRRIDRPKPSNCAF